MPTDKLEDFVRNNREDFDGETPPAGLWDRIEASISGGDAEDADPLASFVAKHRMSFDSETPPPRVESRLFDQPSLQRKTARRRRLLSYALGVAASLLLLFTVYRFGTQTGFTAGREEERIAQQLREMDPELADAERFYRQRISSEFAKVRQVNDDPQLRKDLENVDRVTADLRAQLLEVPASQRAMLVNQLIATYRTKLDILLRIQQHFANPTHPGLPAPEANKDVHES